MKIKDLNDDQDFLYLQLADRLRQQIQDNVLKTGQKLISVRALSAEQGISISTAYKAYAHLEINGLIEARPKSGYYVRYKPVRVLSKHKTPLHIEVQERELTFHEMIDIVTRNVIKKDMLNLSVSGPALSLLPHAKLNKSMVEALRLSENNCISYEEVEGNISLRQHVAKQSFNWGGNINPSEIIITQGCMEALVLCLQAVTSPGDVIAIETPVYFGLVTAIESLNLHIVEIPSDPEKGISLNYLNKAIVKHALKACLFVPNFNNPTGHCMPDENKKQLVELLARHQVPLIEDDIYGDQYFGKTRPRTCKSYDKEGLVLLCSSISKSLAPGYRIGWCIPGKFKTKVASLKRIHSLSSASPTQSAVARFFETGRYDLHMRNLRKALHTQCLRYTQAIAEYFPATVKVSHPKGGYVLWVELGNHIDAFELYEKALLKHISIAPGHIFSLDGRFKNFIRINFGAPYTAELDRAMKTLGELIFSFLPLP